MAHLKASRLRTAVSLLASVLLFASCARTPISLFGVAGVANPLGASFPGRILYVHNGAIEELTSSGQNELASGHLMMPAWSPDGSQIAYIIRQKNFSDLAVMNADGSNKTVLTQDQSSIVEQNLWAAFPTWSNDGKQLIFSTDRGKAEPNIDLRLWMLNFTNHSIVQLTTPLLQAGGDTDPAFRPGHPGQVVFARWYYQDSATPAVSALALLNVPTGARYGLTGNSTTDFQPAWSPDGQYLAYIHRTASGDDLYVAPVPDTLTADITLTPTLVASGVLAQPCWSPTGDSIAFFAQDGDQFDLFQLGIKTTPKIVADGAPQQLTTNGVDATSRCSWTN